MSSNFEDRVMLVTLHIRGPQWTRKDKGITSEVHSQHAAQRDAGRYNKALFSREALALINAAAAELRAYHRDHTLPWNQDGARIIPIDHYLEYAEGMRQRRRAYDDAVGEFLRSYDRHVNDSRCRLGDMFNAEDYPAAECVKDLYGVEVIPDPFPRATDFRADLAQEEVERIRRQITERNEQVQAAAMRELWERLHTCLSRISARLSVPHGEEGGTFRDSLILHLRELLPLLDKLNVTDDPALEQYRRVAAERLAVHEPQTLRDDPVARQSAAAVADAMLRRMGGMFAPREPQSAEVA